MRIYVLLACLIAIETYLPAQRPNSAPIPQQWKNLGIITRVGDYSSAEITAPFKAASMMKAGILVNEVKIGETTFDLQTNQSNQNRIHLFSDGTLGATWCMGMNSAANFPDRGTGYNYFDGSTWSAIPMARVENVKTGWPSYAPYGPSGEIIVSHSGDNTGLVISRRTQKGTGAWTTSYLAGPAINPKLTWPRVVTSGPNNQIIHVLAMTAPVANQGTLYNGQDGALLYYRSSDGGTTWDILHHYFSGLDTSNYIYLGSDVYSWAMPKGDTLAFILATKWTDVVLMKSTDGGSTWSKTIAAYHPYPHFDFDKTIILDTVYVADGASSIVLDAEGKAHLFFGLMRINHEEVGDTYQYFPYTDGLVYWNEDLPPIQTLDFDTLWEHDRIIGYVQDWNGNDTLDLIWGLTGLGKYVMSLSGMPTATMDGNNGIYVIFSSLMENKNNGVQNYRHLLARASFDGGETWNDTILHLTSSITHNYDECVFPSLSQTSNAYIHYVYQADEEPGLAVSGDEDPFTDNKIIYGIVSKTDFGLGLEQSQPSLGFVSQNYPNPFHLVTNIDLVLSRKSTLELRLFNLSGQLIWYKNYSGLQAGHQSIRINPGTINPGVYVMNISCGENQVSRKVVAY